MSDPHEATYGLVMPFVVCTSRGGPYDDSSFSAGWEMGLLDAWLADHSGRTAGRTVRSASLPQVELIAMRHGYLIESEPGDEWATVTFRRPPPIDGSSTGGYRRPTDPGPGESGDCSDAT